MPVFAKVVERGGVTAPRRGEVRPLAWLASMFANSSVCSQNYCSGRARIQP